MQRIWHEEWLQVFPRAVIIDHVLPESSRIPCVVSTPSHLGDRLPVQANLDGRIIKFLNEIDEFSRGMTTMSMVATQPQLSNFCVRWIRLNLIGLSVDCICYFGTVGDQVATTIGPAQRLSRRPGVGAGGGLFRDKSMAIPYLQYPLAFLDASNRCKRIKLRSHSES